MNGIINELIAFLTELRSMSLLTQVLTLAGIPSLVAFVFGLPAWRMTRKARAIIQKWEAERAQAEAALERVGSLNAEVDRLNAETPAAFVERHRRETRDHNDEAAMARAETFIDRQKDALILAFRTRMDEAVRQSVEDGAPAFDRARSWARAALALDPQDRELRMLIAELDVAEAAAAAGARATLKGEAERRHRLARNDRLPTDLAALTNAFLDARGRGHYALMLMLADHGVTVTRRPPFGAGSRNHLLFRCHRCAALFFVGRSREALAEAQPLVDEMAAVFGDRAPETLYARFLMAQCRLNTGDAAGARAELEALLPVEEEVQGPRHPHVLTTRAATARCRLDAGDAAGARAELEATLPVEEEVKGPRHPHVLTTRSMVALCRLETGDAAGARAELEALLPVREEVLGPRHPHVLTTRHGMAKCLLDTGDAAGALSEVDGLLPLQTEVVGARHPAVLDTRTLRAHCLLKLGDRDGAAAAIEAVREGLEAAGRRPEHPSVRRLDEVERALRGEQQPAT
jgi:hypothetical protein